MVDIPNRSELEMFVAKKLAGIFRAELGELLEVLGDPPRIENIPLTFWVEHAKDLEKVVSFFQDKIFMESAERMAAEVSISFDWSLVNESASSWARQFGGNLIKDITDTSRRKVGRAVSNFYSQDWTMGDLTQRLGHIYSPVRAEMIAVTEVTNASMQGEKVIVDELLAKQGIQMRAFWNTSNDELVCPICLPRNGIEKGKGTGGAYWIEERAAHPRCRCSISHRLPKAKKQ